MILLTFIGSQAEKEEMNSFTGSYWWHIIMYLILGGSFVYSLLVESRRSTGLPFIDDTFFNIVQNMQNILGSRFEMSMKNILRFDLK